MRNKLLGVVIATVVETLISVLPKETVLGHLDAMIDSLEDAIADSETEVDDKVLPLIKHLRDTFNIEDND